MKKSQLLFLTTLIASISASSFAISLCEPPAVKGGYTNSPTCIVGIPTTDQAALKVIGAPYSEIPPYVAALEPVIDQNIQRYIFNDYYRYIDMPANQSFKWYITDGSPSTQKYFLITPMITDANSPPEMKITLNNFSDEYFANITNLMLNSSPNNSCSGSIFDGLICPNINDFFNTILPLAGEFHDKNTVKWLASATPQVVEVKTKKTTDGTEEAYLSVRYVETCSGAFLKNELGKYQVMSAGHCYYTGIDDGGPILWDSANINKVYVIGNNWKTSPYVAIQSGLTPTSGNIAPGFISKSKSSVISITDNDYAIVNIKPIDGSQGFSNITPFEISKAIVTSPTQYKMYVVGYGQNEPFKLFGDGGMLLPPTNPILLKQYYKSLSTPEALIGKQTYLTSSKSGEIFYAGNTKEVSTGYGDSGGPIFSVSHGKWFLNGHTLGGDGFSSNQIPNPNDPSKWLPSPGYFTSAYYLCTNSTLKSWLISLNLKCADE